MKLHHAILSLVLLSATISNFAEAQHHQDTLRSVVGNPTLRRELLAMKDREQKIRNDIIAKTSANPVDSSLLIEMMAIDSVNTGRIKQIIHEFGWPGISLVGQDGAQAAFLIVQHSPDTLFQRNCLSPMYDAFITGEAYGQDFALLTDRVLVREGKRQLYGSQARIVDGRLVLEPIEDEANVDKRRADLGLPPLSEYLKLLKQVYHLKE